MYLIDAHNHIHLPEFSTHLDDALGISREKGVGLQLVNATHPENWKRLQILSGNNIDIIPFFGLHPWFSAQENWLENLEKIISENTCGIGEIGLDRYKETIDPDFQEKAFTSQLELAAKYSRPVCIHCMKAWGRLLDIIKNLKPQNGILIHSFGGSKEVMHELADLGAFFSFAGDLAFPERKKKRDIAGLVPAEHILVESDAPDMTPPIDIVAQELYNNEGEPVNSPANLPGIYTFLSELRGEDKDKFIAQTAKNVKIFLKDLNIDRTVFKD